MKAEVEALIDELSRMRKAGVTSVCVSEDALLRLRRISEERSSRRARSEVLDSIPDRVKSADASDFDEVLKASKSPEQQAKKKREQSTSRLPSPPTVRLPEGDKQTQWEALRETVLACPVCNGHVKEGKKVVFGVGDLDADIFFCGEAPGADEEEQGEPFVGKAGQLLNKMIQAMGLKRESVYIGNIMNWRPEMPTDVGNRPPTEEEMGFCLPYLKAQLAIVQPKVVVALGATAAKGLLGFGTFRTLREIKGNWKTFEDLPVMPTYHPSYLLRNSSNRDKRMAWEDWLKVMEKVELPVSDRQRRYFL